MEDYQAFHIRSMLRWLLPFHSKQNPKKYGVQLIGVYIYIYANWVSINFLLLRHIFKNSLFPSISKNIFLFEVLAKIYREWPPHGSMRIKLNLLANTSICCITCLAFLWVSLKVFKYHKFQLNLW
jgi:hypothetical protein